MLGILVIALASYQAIIVPQQNAQTEFDHNQQVEDEMVDFRNALLEARLDNRERATSVTLGTRYQTRTIAVNPPPATGTLQSTPQANFSVLDSDGDEELNLTGNQFFEYTPSYSEYRDAGTIRYENSIVYHDFETANVPLSSQRLVRNGDILLIPNEPEIDEQGTDRVTYEPTPSRLRVQTIENPTIKIPTELEEDDWEELLKNELDVIEGEEETIEDGVEAIDVDDGILTVNFTGNRDVFFTPLPEQSDLGEEPDDDPGDDDDSETEINPAGPGAVLLEEVSYDDNTFTLTFNNTGDDARVIDRGRINFVYKQSGGNRPTHANVSARAGSNRWDIGASFRDLPGNTEIDPGETIELEYAFDGSIEDNRDFFVTALQFENGERSTYFVSSEFTAAGGNGPGGGPSSTPPGQQ